MTSHRDLDLYLAATMRPGADLAERLQRFGISDRQLAAAKARAREAGFHDVRTLTVDLVIVHFGAPTVALQDRLLYDLVVWPQHRFEWRGLASGAATHEGFVMRESPVLPTWLSLSLSSVRSVFRPWFHPRHEIEAVLGDPAVDLSWGEMGEWYYGPALDGSEIVITFDYGLLRSIEHSRGVIASTRRK